MAKNCSSVLKNLGNRLLKISPQRIRRSKADGLHVNQGADFGELKETSWRREMPALVKGGRNPSRGPAHWEVRSFVHPLLSSTTVRKFLFWRLKPIVLAA